MDGYHPLWIWVDLETTGLDVEDPNFGILEIAMITTNEDMEILDSLHIVVHQDENIIQEASNWCKNMYGVGWRGGNGLFGYVRDSKISQEEAGKMMEHFVRRNLKRHMQEQLGDEYKHEHLEMIGKQYKAIATGCSVGYDLRVMKRWFPHLRTLFSHQIMDCTSILHLAKRFGKEYMSSLPPLSKDGMHRAQIDIMDSIRLIKWFKSKFLT
jgi:oligoribonuclease (3'-5' exoribonuclease)